MIWWVYNFLFAIGFVLMLPHFLWRMWKRGGYRRGFGQRLGWYDTETRQQLAQGNWIWIHAVSVGELFIALRCMQAIRFRQSDARFLVTTTTSTGFALAKQRLSSTDRVMYFPVDAACIMRRLLRLARPQRVLLVEYELWPNLIRCCHREGIPVALVNGRLSEKSYRGYRKVHMFTRRLLPWVDHFFMQSEADARRIQALGALPETVHVVGSAKYEVAERDSEAEQEIGQYLESLDMGPSNLLLLGGSTWPGEEQILLRVYQKLKQDHPSLRLVLVPRHAERSAEVMADIKAAGCSWHCRSQQPVADNKPDVLLVDTTGELRHFYAHADIIFIGKSLTRTEGQNIVEAAAYGKPVVVGPRLDNFQAILHDFQSAAAICQVNDEPSLVNALGELLNDAEGRAELGKRAAQLVTKQAGALERTLDVLFD